MCGGVRPYITLPPHTETSEPFKITSLIVSSESHFSSFLTGLFKGQIGSCCPRWVELPLSGTFAQVAPLVTDAPDKLGI